MQYYTLFELNSHLKKILDRHLSPSYWVVAEIGQMQINRRGHCYMELVEKEDDHLHAKMRANLWASHYRIISSRFKAVTGRPLKAGMKILAQVTVEFHEVYGLSLNVRDVDPNFTVGERARKRQQTIEQLEAGGIFNQNRALRLPGVPQKIALISSPSAAGFADFMHQLTRNSSGYHFKVTLFQATMQGNDATKSIIDAFQRIRSRISEFEVVAIVRGGGAQVDLDCFDTYEMAAHVARFPLPVLSGIGHERDQTIVDLVAHTPLKTPTAVATFLLGKLETVDETLHRLTEKLIAVAGTHLKKQEYGLGFLHQKLQFAQRQKLSAERHRLSALTERLAGGAGRSYGQQLRLLDTLGKDLKTKSQQHLLQEAVKLEAFGKNIDHLNPETILKRGYSITHIDNVFVSRLSTIQAGDKITTLIYRKTIESTINQITDNEQ